MRFKPKVKEVSNESTPDPKWGYTSKKIGSCGPPYSWVEKLHPWTNVNLISRETVQTLKDPSIASNVSKQVTNQLATPSSQLSIYHRGTRM